MGKGAAFGKTILMGDQFVLNGVPAIVSALPYQTETTVERDGGGGGFTLIDNRIEVPGYKKQKERACKKSYEEMIKALRLDVYKVPIKITVGGNLPAGSGVGASAAISVSFVKACNIEFKLGLDTVEENYFGWIGEKAYHGTPSGVDNTASSFGGLMMYMIRDGKKMYERLISPKPLYAVLANSGITYNTALLDGHIDNLIQKSPRLFYTTLNKITGQVYDMKKAIEDGDLKTAGEIMTANHKMLIDLDLSHERLVELCGRAVKMGAYGAKLTGGGKGGYMVALTADPGIQKIIARSFEDEGIPVITAQLGTNAVDAEKFRLLK
jgi:mevalonate kinase